MAKLKIDEIKITSAFAETVPSEKKMAECRYNWRMYGKQDRYIVVNHNNVLIDGYVMYKVLMEHKEEYAEVKISSRKKKRWYRKNTKDWKAPHYRTELTTYIYGMHYNKNKGEFSKEYVWRVPKSWGNWADNIQIGDTILCATKNGYAPVVVSRIETLNKCPVDIPVKRVANKQIIRDGVFVELKSTIDC